MDVSRINTEHASKVQIQLREIESLKAGHSDETKEIMSEFVASWQAFCLQKAEEEDTLNSEMVQMQQNHEAKLKTKQNELY
jgi:hypothetical protein